MNFRQFSDMQYVGTVPLPMGVGEISAPAWEPGFDPLLREDWSVRTPVRYAPGEVAEPMFATRADYALDTDSAQGAMAAPELAVAARSSLVQWLETLAKIAAPGLSVPIEGPPELPVIEPVDPSPLPLPVLEAWESALLDACEAGDEEARWLLTQVLALRLAHMAVPAAHALHRTASAQAMRGEEAAPEETRAAWRARRIELDLALARRLSGASRRFALQDIALRHTVEIEHGAGAVLKAWIEVLLYGAQQQLGEVAASRLAEAAVAADRLCGMPHMADEGSYLLARVLLHRAGIERGHARAQTLAQAQQRLDTVFARVPSARVAMAVAEVALQRGREGPVQDAKACFSHALAHAFIAGCDPRWQPASLRCRLAIQLAYEALPEMSPQGHVALDLARKLERQPLPPDAAVEDMAQTFIRHGDYA